MDSVSYRTIIYLIDPSSNVLRKIEAFVLRTIDITTPSETPCFNFTSIKHNLCLAYPNFDRPQKIEIILEADCYKHVILSGIQHHGPLLVQRTVFGWTVTGCVRTTSQKSLTAGSYVTLPTFDAESCLESLLGLVQRFWALEEVPQIKRISAADRECENIYTSLHTRDAEGRYVVPLPLKPERVALLGESLAQAKAALASSHRRMQRDDDLHHSYCQFMNEYAQRGHMRLLTQDELTNYHGPVYYISHHGIWQRSDGGKRVVFNASRSTDSGHRFNDALHSGPELQSHISPVITGWRRHRFVFWADIKMMFRQVKIRPNDFHFQRILWSLSSEAPVQHYVLLTVTYGTACAPYLALRTLKQLCTDEGARFPQAVEIVEHDLYMDDFLSGSYDIESTKRLRHQLIGLLTAGGFSLKKWVADAILTKRKALAELASTFDPAGWLTPITLVAKLIIQDLWRAKLDWDESLPKLWIEKWLKYREGRSEVADIAIPRWLKHEPNGDVQLHAFSDASRRAMAGFVYSRTICDDGETYTILVEAKSRLASITSLVPAAKPSLRMTIPRLELRAALIAAQLLKMAASVLGIPMSSCHLWSDSQIVLHWLQSDGPLGNDLVDNYVAHIQELTAGATWHHVPTDSNPADVASRGSDALNLIRHPMWWNGPDWLAKSENNWPATPLFSDDSNQAPENEEQPTIHCLSTQLLGPVYRDHLEHFSTLRSLLRGTARVCRWIHRKVGILTTHLLNPITAIELRHSFLVCVKLSQRQTFAVEIEMRRKNKRLQGQSPLKTLEPFLDADGVLRVGGRLDNSALPYDERHPVLLDGRSHLAQLVLRWAHERSLHGRFRATSYPKGLDYGWKG